MDKMKALKESICQKLMEILDSKAEIAMRAIESAKDARDQDTKSSAGDKYETGRELMQIEMEKNHAQLTKAAKLKSELAKVNVQKKFTSVEFGSLVLTNEGHYFISIGIGEIAINNKNYYCISLASPIGNLLHRKEVGDIVQFQGREFTIRDIM